jgi:putative transposase
MAMSPKDAWFQTNSELKQDWPYGQMRRLICDNGLEFHGDNFKNFLKRFNMSVTWVRKKRGDDKGIVERLFERMSEELFHRMPGTTLSSPKEKGDYNSTHHATLTLRELARIVECWFVNDYSIEMHEGLKGRPLVEWKKKTAEFCVEVPPDVGVLNLLLFPGEPRSLGREGVHVHGIKYGVDGNEDLFFEMLNDPLKPKALPVKYDPSNLTYVYVEDWRVSGRFLRLKARAKEAWDKSLVEWNYYTEFARAAQKKEGRIYEPAIREARVNIAQKVKELAATQKLRGRRFARLTEPTILPAQVVVEAKAPVEVVPEVVVTPAAFEALPVIDLPDDPHEFLRECDEEGVW